MDSSTLRTLLTRIVHAAADGGCDVAWIEEEKNDLLDTSGPF